VLADVDREEVDRVRSEFPALHDRRFDAAYSLDG
jgi:predicted amidohydrolase